MKKIILVRHGKAEDGSPEISDFERSLTLKGKIISRLMARELMEREKTPGIILTSPAFRALETALIFAGEFGLSSDEIVLNSSLYSDINLKDLKDLLSDIDADTEIVTMFGHNPSFSEIADSLSKDGCDLIPKSGVVCISFNITEWHELKQKKGKTDYFLVPEK
jgi:phosphohistidine phosphatase